MRLYRASPGRDENPRPGFDHWRSQWDSLRASRADCPKGEARRAESIPPSPPYSKKKPELTLRLFCVYIAPAQGGMRTLDQGSTGGLPPGRQDRLRACRPKGEAHRAESIPPSPPYLKKEPELTLRLFCVYMPRPDGRCASLTCPTCIKRNGFVGWVSVSAPTVYRANRMAGALRLPALPASSATPFVVWVSVSAPTFYHAKPAGRCASLTCPTHIKRNGFGG